MALFTMLTVAPGITAPEGSVIVPRKEVKAACGQATPTKTNDQKQGCDRLTEGAHAHYLSKKV